MIINRRKCYGYNAIATIKNLEHENNCGEERNGLATSIEGEYEYERQVCVVHVVRYNICTTIYCTVITQ